MKIIDHEFRKVKKKKRDDPLCVRRNAIPKKSDGRGKLSRRFFEPPSLIADPCGGVVKKLTFFDCDSPRGTDVDAALTTYAFIHIYRL